MKNKKFVFRFFQTIVLLLALSFFSCEVKSPVAPIWDVEVNVPIANRSYTLAEALRKDTALIKSYDSPDVLGLLYYSDVKDLEKITVGETIEFKSASSDVSVLLDDLTVDDPSGLSTAIPIQEWTTFNPPTTTVVPVISSQAIQKSLNRIQQFEQATFETGQMLLDLSNNNGSFPINAERLRFLNARTNAVVLDSTISPVLVIPGNSSRSVQFNLAGRTFPDSLKIEVTISSPGSGGVSISIPANAKTDIDVSFQNLHFLSIKGVLPQQQPIDYSEEVEIDDSTFYKDVTLSSGSLEVGFENYIDIEVNVTLTIQELKEPGGVTYSKSVLLGRRGTASSQNKIVISNLENYRLYTTSSFTNKLKFDIKAQPVKSNSSSTIAKNDSITSEFRFYTSKVKIFTGKLRPTLLDSSLTTYKIELKNFDLGFTFHQINFKNPEIDIHLKTSVDFDVKFEGKISGSNSKQIRYLPLPPSILHKGDNIIAIDKTQLSNFLSGFEDELPDTLIILGKAHVNPNYQVGTVASSDTIIGDAYFEFPLNVGIAGGNYQDTTSIEFDEDSKKLLENINQTDFVLDITNGLPIAITYTGYLEDSSGNFLMKFPPSKDSVQVAGGITDGNGNVITFNQDTTLMLFGRPEVEKLLKASRLISTIKMNTTKPNNQPVRFKTSDIIFIRAYGKLNYQINP